MVAWGRKSRINSLAKSLGVLAVTGGLKGLVEGERHIARDGEVVKCGIGKSLFSVKQAVRIRLEFLITDLLGITGVHCWLDLAQTFADKQSTVNEHAVGGAIDFKIAEQDVRTE